MASQIVTRGLAAVGVFGLLAVLAVAQSAPVRVFAQETTYCEPGKVPQLGQEFQALAMAVGSEIGEVLECEHTDAESGDIQQHTSAGLLYLRKSTNTPTFTNGAYHWAIRGSDRLEWTGDSIDPPLGISVAGLEFEVPGAVATAVLAWGLYIYVAIALAAFLVRVRTRGFVRRTLFYAALMTVSLCALWSGSPLHMAWGSNPGSFGLVPVELSLGRPTSDAINVSSPAYWLLSSTLTWLLVALPLATMGAWVTTVRGNGVILTTLLAAGRLLSYAITIAVVLVAVTMTVRFVTYPATNPVLILAGCALFLAILWKCVDPVRHAGYVLAIAVVLTFIVVTIGYLVMPNPPVNPLVLAGAGALLLWIVKASNSATEGRYGHSTGYSPPRFTPQPGKSHADEMWAPKRRVRCRRGCNNGKEPCYTCGSRGSVYNSATSTFSTCPACRGQPANCQTCGGSGMVDA